jgi:transcriptional regulator with XRE-family HTH domain
MKRLNAEIKRYLEENGIKQVFLQSRIGLGVSSLNALLNGNRGITAEEYFAICRALNLPLDYFTTDTTAIVNDEKRGVPNR